MCDRMVGMKLAIAMGTAWTLGAAMADTLTWKSEVSSGAFSSADNWTSDGTHTAPQSGDTCVFPNSAVTLTAETFDIGASGLTINNPAQLRINTTFTGTGGIVKKGAGKIVTDASSTYTGGTTFYGGQWYADGGTGFGKLGTGSVTFEFDSSNPYIDVDKWDAKVPNKIIIKGNCTAGNGALYFHQPSNVASGIDSTCDFKMYFAWNSTTFTGPISCPGKTVNICALLYNQGTVTCTGAIDGSVNMTGWRTLALSGKSSGSDNKLTVSAGTCKLTSTGYWGGTNVVVCDSSVLQLCGRQNLSPAAAVTVKKGGKLSLDAACKVHVRALTVNGEVKAAGTYTSANIPDFITGSGSIVVKPISGKVHYWAGGASGAWSTAANWKDGVAPAAGDMVFFESETTLTAESVEIGDAGISLVNAAKLTSNVAFSGNGGIDKFGDGLLVTAVSSSFAGGAIFHGGQWSTTIHHTSHQFGTGAITFDFDSSNPFIDIDQWGVTINNPIILKGKCTAGNGALFLHQTMTFSETITSTEDFTIAGFYGPWGGFNFKKPISCPGKTLTMRVEHGTGDYVKAQIYDSIDGSLVKVSNRDLILSGKSNGLDNKMTVNAGKCDLTSTGYWGGTNVVVNGSTAILQLDGDQNLSEQAVVAVLNGGKINVASGKKTKVAGLWVDGVELAPGHYTKTKLPSTFTGDGKLIVGQSGMTLLLK